MKKIRWIVALALLLCGLACVVPLSEYEKGQYILKPQGERIKVMAKNGGTLEGEFLFVDEESVYFLAEVRGGCPPKVVAEPFGKIRELKILGVRNGKWLTYVLGFQIAPAILLGATYAAWTEDTGGATLAGLAAIPGIVTGLLFLTTTPSAPRLAGEIDLDRLKDFLKYARYPFVPDPELKQKILDDLKRPSLKIAVRLP